MVKEEATTQKTEAELGMKIEEILLRLLDLVKTADEYKPVSESGVWFLIGQAYGSMQKAKRLLAGDDPEAVALEWMEDQEKEVPDA